MKRFFLKFQKDRQGDLSKKQSQLNAFLAQGTQFKGSLSANTSIRIDGDFEGDIVVSGDVWVGSKSMVKATIKAKNIHVYGHVQGQIEALGTIHIYQTGQVYGALKGTQLMVEDGGVYKGKVNMDVLSSHNPYEGHFELTFGPH